MRRTAVFVTLLVALAPALLVYYYIHTNSINFLLGDEWINRLPVALRSAEGTLQVSDFFEPFGGMKHRVVFAQLSAALSTRLFNWDIRAENLLTLAVAAITLVLMTAVYNRSSTQRNRLPVLVVFALGAWLIFCLQGSLIWLSMIYAVRMHAVIFFFAGLLALTAQRLTNGRVFIAIICAVCATFSVSIGAAVWPAYLFHILCHPNRKWRYLAVMLITGVISLVIFYYGLSISKPLAKVDWETLVTMIPVSLGAPFSPQNVALSAVVGLVGLLFFIFNSTYLYNHCMRHALFVPFAMTIFALLAQGLTALARSFRGIEAGLRSWYIPQSSVFWLALLMVGISVVLTAHGHPARMRRRLIISVNGIFLIVLSALYLSSASTEMNTTTQSRRQYIATVEHCLRLYPFTGNPSCLSPTIWGNKSAGFTDTLMSAIIGNNLLAYSSDNLYQIPDSYVAGSPLWVNIADAHQAELIAYAVLPSLPIAHKTTEASNVPALMEVAELTGQFWTIHNEGSTDSELVAAEGVYEVIYQDRFLPDAPFILTGYRLR